MLKNKKLYSTLSILFVLSTLTGCASSPPPRMNDNSYQTQTEVDESMAKAVQGINASLKTMVATDRGTLVAPDKGPLRTSVGYDINNKVAAPIALDVSKLSPYEGTPSYTNKVSMDEQTNTTLLSKKIKINWNGSASELLSQVAKTIGYSYYTVNDFTYIPDVKVKTLATGDSVESVLKQVADQISTKADVNVNVSPVGDHPKSISLSYKQAK